MSARMTKHSTNKQVLKVERVDCPECRAARERREQPTLVSAREVLRHLDRMRRGG
jgi:hypothetical protein